MRYAGPRDANSASTSVNDLITGNAALKNLAIEVGNLQSGPAIDLESTSEPAAGTIGTFNPALYHPENQTITWITGLVDYGVDNGGQDPTQILFHEYDHAYYDDTAGSTAYLSPTMSASLGGVTYSWTIYSLNSSGAAVVNQAGLAGYQHMLIDDDLKSTFGSDKTGALAEALGAANNHPSNPANIASKFASTRASFGSANSEQKGRPTAPSTSGQSCSATRKPAEIPASAIDLVSQLTGAQ